MNDPLSPAVIDVLGLSSEIHLKSFFDYINVPDKVPKIFEKILSEKGILWERKESGNKHTLIYIIKTIAFGSLKELIPKPEEEKSMALLERSRTSKNEGIWFSVDLFDSGSTTPSQKTIWYWKNGIFYGEP